MRKYIDADILRAYMKTFLTGNDLYTPNGIEGFVESLPAYDVQKVRHGRWVDCKRICFDGTFHWFRQCSKCLYERKDDNSEKDTNYCPNCGAKMDEDGEKDE